MYLCEQTIAGNKNKNSTGTSSSMYTPQKKKQKMMSRRPPRAPTKATRTPTPPPWVEEEESRCEQEHRAAQSSCFPAVGRENNVMTIMEVRRRTNNDRMFQTTPTPWNTPALNHHYPVSSPGHQRPVEDDNDQYESTFLEGHQHQVNRDDDEMGRTSSLEGLELLEMMSFDEGDCYQGGDDNDDDDVSLSYSIASEGY
jgi:hypothetical protein